MADAIRDEMEIHLVLAEQLRAKVPKVDEEGEEKGKLSALSDMDAVYSIEGEEEDQDEHQQAGDSDGERAQKRARYHKRQRTQRRHLRSRRSA